MWTDTLFFLYNHGWLLLWIGLQIAGAGVVGIVLTRAELILGPDPEMPTIQIGTSAIPHPHVPLRQWDTLSELSTFVADLKAVEDATTAVIARIPGATPGSVCPACGGPAGQCTCSRYPANGPVCPTCGGPFGNCTCAAALTIVIPAVPTYGERLVYTGRHREDGDTRPLTGSVARAKAAKP